MINKPFKSYSKSTKIYTIIDFNECRRGPDNMVFSMHHYKNKKSYPKTLEIQAKEALLKMEKISGKKFGDAKNPLLVSIRSGARKSRIL